VRTIKRKLKKIQYRPQRIDGYLARTGLKIEPWNHMHYEFKLVGRPVGPTASDYEFRSLTA
jgi:hypothetical protein